jgi:hypothetical protein
MKGAYPTLSHSIMLILGLTAMSLMIFSISMSLANTEKNLVTTELNFFADSIKNKILEVYSLANQSSNYTTGLFQLNLPEKIGDRRYSIALYQGGMSVNASVRSKPIEINRSLAIDAELNGTYFMPVSIKIEKQDGKIKIGLIK